MPLTIKEIDHTINGHKQAIERLEAEKAALNSWSLDEGLAYIRVIHSIFEQRGWTLSLGGSVLETGTGPCLSLYAHRLGPCGYSAQLTVILPKYTTRHTPDGSCYSYKNDAGKLIELHVGAKAL